MLKTELKLAFKSHFRFATLLLDKKKISINKSASEPNLLKIRLKQSVIERKARAGPLAARRQERLLLAHQRRLQKHVALAQATSMLLIIS